MALTPQSLQQQREDLYTQVKQASQQQAQSNYQTGLTSLKQQIQQQRLNMNQSRGQIAEQGALQQRQITNQMASRGLGNSGLRDLAGLQSQLAQGQSINQLEQQNGLIQQEAMNARRSLSSELTNNLRAADLTYADQMTQSSERTYEQEQQAKQFTQSAIMELANMRQNGASSEDVMTWGSMMGIDFSTLDPALKENLNKLGEQNPELVSELTGINVDELKSEKSKDLWSGIGLSVAGVALIIGSIAGALPSGGVTLAGLGTGVAAVGQGINKFADSGNVFNDGKPVEYNVAGAKITATSAKEAQTKITQHYASKYSEVANNLIKITVNKAGNVSFSYNGEKFKTFGQARAALNNAPR